ncbi:hypothetical protein COV04_03615 [Candidatus Uhrbacteria bacterium CG10_big_fil_rev_8_21_14_0_10_48_11]|uniref:DUF721 domain-containing protein n=1 Tax=Candidatus Uhrbacteria bacterium CG10_big_fil_rev_8_21_14_0_10_48_11 TaxID=1975037 RepID=A0A2M8LDY8_9BACT|nr:MAG: hypothetical protein COV04_03615 [Candidatus Uhrbacteria bacterium CG10_big_fil_rev_8_21_14_0_10_48_11]
MLKSIGDYLQGALNRTGADRAVSAAVVVENAELIIRQMLPDLHPADLSVVSFAHGTITIGAANTAVGQELKLRADALLEALRSTFPKQGIKRLRVRPTANRGRYPQPE